jgi:uncharacterized protein YbaP (TraB family)
MDAFGRSDYLAVEIWAPEGPNILDLFAYTDGRTVADVLGEELHGEMLEVLEEIDLEALTGLTAEFLDNFKPAMWISVLAAIQVEKSEVSFDYGIEAYFTARALERGMDIISIECPFENAEISMNLSMELQHAWLRHYLDIESGVREIHEVYFVWKQGCEYGLEAIMHRDLAMLGDDELAAEFLYYVIRHRDVKMAETARSLMREGKKVFFIAGAAHMVGEGSIPYLLIQEGYEVVRLPK